MSKPLDFRLAGSEDEVELRALLRQQPLPGWISLTFEREPDYFAASTIEGERHSVLLARDPDTGSLVGFSSRAVRRVYIDGEIRWLGYLGQLRVTPSFPGGYRTYRQLARGFAISRHLQHRSDELPYDITSILGDNLPAKRLLGANLSGMPFYKHLCGFSTLVYRGGLRRSLPRSVDVENGTSAGLPAIADCLTRNHARYRYAPVWDTEALSIAGLRAEDFLVMRDGERVVACAAIWDQRSARQIVVQDYKSALRLTRPLLNLLAPMLGLPSLPAVGQGLNQGWFSHLACDDDHEETALQLLAAALKHAKGLGLDQLATGLSDDHPLLAAFIRPGHLAYRSDIYKVHEKEQEPDADTEGDQPLHLEVATL